MEEKHKICTDCREFINFVYLLTWIGILVTGFILIPSGTFSLLEYLGMLEMSDPVRLGGLWLVYVVVFARPIFKLQHAFERWVDKQ